MGLGAALQQIGTMYLQRNFQKKDRQEDDARRKQQLEEDQRIWEARQQYLARLQAPQERVRQVYDEQLKAAVNVRESYRPPTGDMSQGPPEAGRWVEEGRDRVAPKDKQAQVISGWQGNQQVTGIVDPDDPSSFKPLFTGAPPKSQIVGGSGGGRGKAPSGYEWTDEGDLEPISGGPADLKQKAAETKATTFSSSDKKNIASLRQSLGNLDAIEAQLNQVEAAYEPLKGSWSAGGGGQGMIPTEGGKRFDAAVGQLAPLMRQLTRVPGEGAMSDYETKLMERANLNRGDYESTTAEKIKNLRQLVGEARQARTSALDVYGLDGNGEPKAKQEPNAAPKQGYKVGDIITEGGKRYKVIGGTPDDPEVEPL